MLIPTFNQTSKQANVNFLSLIKQLIIKYNFNVEFYLWESFRAEQLTCKLVTQRS